MEKIAIFDTNSGATPTPPIVTPAISFIYGTSANQTRSLTQFTSNTSNLVGGGSAAVLNASDSSVKGNVFPCSYTIASDFYINLGSVQSGGSPATFSITIEIIENGVSQESWTQSVSTNARLTLAFSTLTTFQQDNAYCVRISGLSGTQQIEVTGWSVAVQFLSLT